MKVSRLATRMTMRGRWPNWLLPVLKQILPLSLGLLCLWILAHRMSDMDLDHIFSVLTQVTLPQWLAAAGATTLSFWAVGRYDAVVHRHWRTGFSGKSAAFAGVNSIALAQTLGLGVLTGALARWRMMPDLGLAMATKISATVAVSFLAGWSVITALANLLLDGPALPVILIVAPLILFILLIFMAFMHPNIAIWGRNFTLPSLTAIGAITLLTLIDTAAAAAALQLLLPASLDIPFQTLFPVFLIALGAALISGTPGGVGPFELTMLALLPATSAPDLIGAILAFRILYYAIPAVIALIVLARPPRLARTTNMPRLNPYQIGDNAALHRANRAETGLALFGETKIMHSQDSALLVFDSGQSLNQLFDPIQGTTSTAIASLKTSSKQYNKLYSLYKCTPKVAVCARHHGLRLLHIADEAVLDPSRFSLNTPAYRQLRRKLRHAEKSALKIEHAKSLPLPDMAAIDDAWIAYHGRARGATMGRFSPDYLASQRVYLAWQDGALVGFISLHINANEICLDLMRAHPNAPDGTMHALVHAAITTAANENRTRFSLAALPARPARATGVEKWLRRAALRHDGGRGLIQFKTCFKPRLQPLYMAAPSWASMIISLADLARAVHFPPEGAPVTAPENRPYSPALASPLTPPHTFPHNDYDNLEIAPRTNL